MAIDLSKIAFDSRENYMKRSEFVGSTDITLDGSAGGVSTYTVTHNLGYVPFFIVGADVEDDGVIWSNDPVDESTETSLAGLDRPVRYNYWADDTELTIALKNGTGTKQSSGTRTVYWIIYLDYGS